MSDVNEQWVIVYLKAGKAVVFATAYDPDECRRQIALCQSEHGYGCNARARPAEEVSS